MFGAQYEAEMKFWRSPELIVKLLPFLDLKSTLCLARSHDLTKNILQRGFAWNNLVRRTCPFGWEEDQYVLQHKIDVVKDLVSILKLLKHPKVLLLDLLDAICDRFPADSNGLQIPEMSVGCPRHPGASHNISWSGFLLLEEVEGAFGTTEQSLGSVYGETLRGATLAALSSRISRQQQKVNLIHINDVEILSDRCVKAFETIMQVQPSLSRPIRLWMVGGIGRWGWEVIAKVLRLQPHVVVKVAGLKEDMGEARKGDIKDIWDAVGHGGFRIDLNEDGDFHECVGKQNVENNQTDNAWKRVEHILEITDDEWVAQLEGEDDEGNQ